MKLEQLRENDIGATSAWIPSLGEGPNSMARLTYLQFAHLAFYYSGQQVEQLEYSTNQINQGNAIQAVTGLWFMSIEAYINSILRVACLVKELSFDELKKKTFGTRISELFNILQIDKYPFYSETIQRLEEFKRYRNELFHDRTNENPIEFHKTMFSGNPFFANQVDIIQAAKIAIEVYHSFRNVIPRLDLMPQIIITKNDSFFYQKIDYLYQEVLVPHFEQSLLKHSLTTSLNAKIDAEVLEESKIFSATRIEILIKAIPDEKYHITPSKMGTQIGEKLLHRIREKVVFDTKNSFQVANYYR